jgi:hypothetical protein
MGLSSCAAAGALIASVAQAQDAEPAQTESEAEGAPPEAPPEDATPAPVGEDPEADRIADAQAGDSPAELPGKSYYFVGGRYRGIVMPKFMQNLFADGGRTVYIHGFGPEFGIRKNGFEYSLSPWLALYNLDDTGFKGKSDGETAWEIISADIKILYLTSDFMWTHDFSPEFGLNYGVGAGFGIVFGDLRRNQSYPTADGQNPDDYSKCRALNDPDQAATFDQWYCDDENDHFGNYTEPSWANGGSKPNIFPWLALQTGVRYKPSRNFVARLDLGFGTSGFLFGLGLDYGL